MYRQICQKSADFLSAQKAFVSTFFQMFIVLVMYNFCVKPELAMFHNISKIVLWDMKCDGRSAIGCPKLIQLILHYYLPARKASAAAWASKAAIDMG